MIERALRTVVAAAFASLLLTGAVIAQTVGASLQGIVTDPTGAALQNADVVVVAVATGAVRELKTDTSGRYRVPVLQPGEYEVHVSQTGFQPVARRGIQLTVGQNAVIDIKMELSRLAEEMTVTGQSPVVNVTSGSVSGLVGDKEIRELPLNGRSFQQLALLQTGVTPALAAGNDVVGGRTPKISINGARPEQSSFLLDGTDINNVYNKTPGSSAGVLLGVEAVLEFQVLTNAYSAEFGRSAGGVINAVTRSGANVFHGSGFEFHRNSALDAKNYFDPKDLPIPDFYRHQFGAVAGGPIKKDRTFYFAAFEGLIERFGVTGVTAVPDDDARLGNLPGRTVTLHPLIPTYLNTLFPRANGRSLGGGASELLFTKTQPTNEYFTQIRVDHRFTGGDSLFARSGNLNTTGFSMNERPDLKPGFSDNPILGGPDRYWDINAFALPAPGVRGNLGRNTLTGPGLVNFDLSMIKSFPLQRSQSIQARIEIFNLFNRANFAVPSGRIAFTNAAGDVSPTWGRITSTVTTARQMQLGVKYLF